MGACLAYLKKGKGPCKGAEKGWEAVRDEDGVTVPDCIKPCTQREDFGFFICIRKGAIRAFPAEK